MLDQSHINILGYEILLLPTSSRLMGGREGGRKYQVNHCPASCRLEGGSIKSIILHLICFGQSHINILCYGILSRLAFGRTEGGREGGDNPRD